MADFILRFGLLKENDQFLDIGCGTGAMAFALASRLGAKGRYVGFDVYRPAIDWCRSAFSGDSRFSFELAEIASAYGEPSQTPLCSFRFTIGDQKADFILAKSVFTHLLEDEARHYLSEIQRTLRPGRTGVITAFLFGRGSLTDRGESPIFRFGDEPGVLRWRWRARPASAVAYERDHFAAMIRDAGLRLQWMCQGFWPGDQTAFTAQDILLLGH